MGLVVSAEMGVAITQSQRRRVGDHWAYASAQWAISTLRTLTWASFLLGPTVAYPLPSHVDKYKYNYKALLPSLLLSQTVWTLIMPLD